MKDVNINIPTMIDPRIQQQYLLGHSISLELRNNINIIVQQDLTWNFWTKIALFNLLVFNKLLYKMLVS